ncbi:MAG: FliM/FliN family flagellar motor switch protein [Planctomycetia bacterium]|nr:FliM/FliN family flagellar motor switch protein [Planctomycetia bacterium]
MTEDHLSPAEIQSLLGAVDPSEMDSTPMLHAADVVSRNDTFVTLDPRAMAGLRRMHSDFCQRLGVGLSSLMRADVRPRLADIQQTRWDNFTSRLPVPTCLNLLRAEPLGAETALIISPAILYPMLDRMLGGNGHPSSPIPRRPLTEIELRLARRILQAAVRELQTVWREIVPLTLRGDRVESNCDNLAIATEEETVIVIACEIALDESRGPLYFCLPTSAIEPHVRRLATAAMADASGANAALRQAAASAGGAIVELTAHLAETTMTHEELLDLQVGDIITTPRPATEPVLVTVEGLPKFHGRVGRHQGHLAVRIEERISAGSSPEAGKGETS